MKNRQAFTMVELVFVIVVVGILSAVAIPKLAATRYSATISKARATVAAVRNAIATERQTRILRGDFLPITSLASDGGVGGTLIFDQFNVDARGKKNPVLIYPLTPCASASSRECWVETTLAGANMYTYRIAEPVNKNVTFIIGGNNTFACLGSSCGELID